MNEKTKNVTTVSSIDWKRSFQTHPFIAVLCDFNGCLSYIECGELSKDGKTLTINDNDIFEFLLERIEGCFKEESNFTTVLESYYGREINNLEQVRFICNRVEVIFRKGTPIKEVKLKYIKDSLYVKNQYEVVYASEEELKELESDPELKELIRERKAEFDRI